MTDILQTITQFLGTHRSRPRENCHGPIAEPHRDWQVVFFAFLLVLLLFAALAALVYLSVEETASSGEESTTVLTPQGPSSAQLSSVLNAYQTKAAMYQALLAHAPAIPDPGE